MANIFFVDKEFAQGDVSGVQSKSKLPREERSKPRHVGNS